MKLIPPLLLGRRKTDERFNFSSSPPTPSLKEDDAIKEKPKESEEIVTESEGVHGDPVTGEENSDPAWGEMAENWYNSGWGQVVPCGVLLIPTTV